MRGTGRGENQMNFIRMGCALVLLQALGVSAAELEGAPLDPQQSFVLVSDVDDTLKITGVSSYHDLISHWYYGTGTFLGMSELYQELLPRTEKLVYLSGSPQSLEKSLRTLLITTERFPEGEFILSNWFYWEKTEKFKRRELAQLSKRFENSLFLLVGDDTQQDPEVFLEFQKAHPDLLSIYIHRVTGRALPENVKTFSTAYEMALLEFEAGRLDQHQVSRVGEIIAQASTKERIFPDHIPCPEKSELTLGPKAAKTPDLISLNERVGSNIQKMCKTEN